MIKYKRVLINKQPHRDRCLAEYLTYALRELGVKNVLITYHIPSPSQEYEDPEFTEPHFIIAVETPNQLEGEK